MAEDTLRNSDRTVYSVGPIIHNPQEVERLSGLGMIPLSDQEEYMGAVDIEGDVVVIRSHGIAPEKRELLEKKGAVLVDATCPVVRQAQETAREMVERGCLLIIIGAASHPEILGIVGSVSEEPLVVASAEEARRLVKKSGVKKVGVISQTTGGIRIRGEVVAELRAVVQELEVGKTICESHLQRQEEAERLAEKADLVLVVGGRNSSNTANLAKLCETKGTTTYHIEDENEIRKEWLEEVETVVILGGASTPKGQVERVRKKIVSVGEEY